MRDLAPLTPEQDLRIRFILSKAVNHQLAKENARLREQLAAQKRIAESYGATIADLVTQRCGRFTGGN